MNRMSIIGIGDVLVDRKEPTESLKEIRPLLESSNLSMGNFEGVLTDSHAPTPGSARATVVPSSNVEALNGFSIMSLANNHSMDAGYGGLDDTIASLTAKGINVVGAGSTLTEALQPVVYEQNGINVGVVAVTSVFRVGTDARKGLPGIAPLRARDYYSPRHPGDYGPGVPPAVVSILNEKDWNNLQNVIQRIRKKVDVLIVSIHWGDYSRPWVLTDHETSCAKKLIDVGVDIIFGHHHHFFRGIQFIKGKPVFYGLGHIAFDHPRFANELSMIGIDIDHMSGEELKARFGEYGIYPRIESPDFPFHPLSRHTGAAVVEVDKTGFIRCGIIPCYIDYNGVTQAILRNNTNWETAIEFLKECIQKGNLETKILDDGWSHWGYDVVELTS